MAWTVSLYCPKSDEWSEDEYTCGQTCTAIAMWTTAVTVVVPLALFLFAAIADYCCCCCRTGEDDLGADLSDIRFRGATMNTQMEPEVVKEMLKDGTWKLVSKTNRRNWDDTSGDLLCRHLGIPEEVATSDEALVQLVSSRLTLMTRDRKPMVYSSTLIDWLTGRGLNCSQIEKCTENELLCLDIVRQMVVENSKSDS
jgi:hypothetical protein